MTLAEHRRRIELALKLYARFLARLTARYPELVEEFRALTKAQLAVTAGVFDV